MTEFKIVLSGDSLIAKDVNIRNEDNAQLKSILGNHHLSFTNLEGVVHDFPNDIYAAQSSGGDWVSIPPNSLKGLKDLGFNALCLCNNHSMDFLHQGILSTINYVKENGFIAAGSGCNLYEASKPAYYDSPNGRIAIVCFTTAIEDYARAGEMNRQVQGRPGVNLVGHDTIHIIPDSEYTSLYSSLSNIIDDDYWDYELNDNEKYIRIGSKFFISGAERKSYTRYNSNDMNRIIKSIKEAKRQSDYVIVSCHTHEHTDSDFNNTNFLEDIAHACIDAGADCYAAHGPHVIRGIEIYKNSPIFYSLGDFFYQCELLSKAPDEFFHIFGDFSSNACTADVYDYRIESGGILGETCEDFFQSVLVSLTAKSNEVLIEIIPIDLQFNQSRATKGTPKIATGKTAYAILQKLIMLSTPYKTQIEIKNERAYIHIK